MHRILVTGGAGFVGSNAANWFSRNGYEVIAIDDLSLGWQQNLEPSVTFIKGDVNRKEDLEKVGKVDFVIHLAASSSAPMFTKDLGQAVTNNINGHIKVMEYATKVGAKKMLFASTSSIYGNNPVPLTEYQPVSPPNYYATSKHAQEELSQVYSQINNLEIIGFRFMSVYGLHEEHKGSFANLVSQFIWGMEQGKQPTIYGDGTQTRDLTNVKDLIQAFKLALDTEKHFGYTMFNVGTSLAINMLDLMVLLNKAMGTNIPGNLIENPIKSGYVKHQQASLAKIERELGYKPTVTLEDGVREIVDFRKTNPIPPSSLSF